MALTKERMGEIALIFVQDTLKSEIFCEARALTKPQAERIVAAILEKSPPLPNVTCEEFLEFFLCITPQSSTVVMREAIIKHTKK